MALSRSEHEDFLRRLEAAERRAQETEEREKKAEKDKQETEKREKKTKKNK
jgi:hypothetical protein